MSLYFGNRQVALNLGDAIRDTILPEPTAANAGRIVKVGEEGGYVLGVENDSSTLLNSPNFTGTPTVPDLTSTSDGTQIANKNYVDNHIPDLSGYMQKGVDYVTAGQKSGTILGTKATAEGYDTTATANYSHAEGNNTTASGIDSHAEGLRTKASGSYSHAEGNNTTAQRRSQHVFGEYNVLDATGSNTSDKGSYVEIVGNGTSSTRSNARTLDWSGNEVLAGKLTVGAAPTANMDVATKQYVDTAVGTVDALPSQNGNSGKFLTTDGTAASWATKPTYTAAEVGALDNTYFGYLDANANILYLPKNWSYSQSASDYSYWFSFIARDNYNTNNIKSGLKLRIFGSSSNLFTIEGFTYEGEDKTLPFSLSPGIYLARFNDGFLDAYRVTTKSDIPTYTLSMSGNRITLTPSSGTASYIDLPVYDGELVR